MLQVNLFREITFRNSKQTYKGIPLIASNMDTVGTFEMAKALAKVSNVRVTPPNITDVSPVLTFYF